MLAGPNLGEHGKAAGTVATAAILGAAVLSYLAMFVWLGSNWPEVAHHGHDDHHATAHDDGHAPSHAVEGTHASGGAHDALCRFVEKLQF